MMNLFDILGLSLINKEETGLPDEIMKLIEERESARKSKDWEKADEIRKRLKKIGIILRDYPKGTVWIKE